MRLIYPPADGYPTVKLPIYRQDACCKVRIIGNAKLHDPGCPTNMPDPAPMTVQLFGKATVHQTEKRDPRLELLMWSLFLFKLGVMVGFLLAWWIL